MQSWQVKQYLDIVQGRNRDVHLCKHCIDSHGVIHLAIEIQAALRLLS